MKNKIPKVPYPAPFSVRRHRTDPHEIQDALGVTVAHVFRYSRSRSGECVEIEKARIAMLLAAAPTLASALEHLLVRVRRNGHLPQTAKMEIERAEAALVRAGRGR